MDLRAGTSGYSYKEWKGAFYPEDLAAAGMLEYYGSKLPTVEINNTFYRLPRTSVLETWASQVPETFRFAIKASRRITHMKRLNGTEEETGYLLSALETLGPRLGVVLFQLPPNLKKDLPRLEAFLELVGKRTRPVIEFRHPSWFDDEVFACLDAADCALCAAETDEERDPPLVATAPYGYVRLRRAGYTDAELSEWIERIGSQGWGEAFVFFKHEDDASGPEMARRFLELAS